MSIAGFTRTGLILSLILVIAPASANNTTGEPVIQETAGPSWTVLVDRPVRPVIGGRTGVVGAGRPAPARGADHHRPVPPRLPAAVRRPLRGGRIPPVHGPRRVDAGRPFHACARLHFARPQRGHLRHLRPQDGDGQQRVVQPVHGGVSTVVGGSGQPHPRIVAHRDRPRLHAGTGRLFPGGRTAHGHALQRQGHHDITQGLQRHDLRRETGRAVLV